ncbi:MAG: amidohydrolase family protein, partial [Chloroflexi bacterium]|nr:amidohydrolase family protein [Chloroflexota bacterium]
MAFVLEGGLVWRGLPDERAGAGGVTIDGARIVDTVTPDASIERIAVPGCTVMPGLIEAHAHLCLNGEPDWRAVYDGDGPERMLLRMAASGEAMLRSGITTVRDLGAPTALAVALRDAIRAGVTTGPDLLVAGAPVTTTGGHCFFMGGEADGELGVRVAVRTRVKAGVDWIKVMASGGNMTPGSNPYRAQYTVAELSAVVEEAHRLGRRVAAHCHGVEGIRAAVAARCDTLEHCSFQTPDGAEPDDAVIAEIAERGLVISPTVTSAFGQTAGSERWERRADLLRRIFAAGCRVLMSTDCGIPNAPHDALAGAMQALAAAAGLSPVETLRLATSRSAE